MNKLHTSPAAIAALAAELHAYADAVAVGTEPVPAMRRMTVDEWSLKVVPRVLHDVLCTVRVATPQDTDPVVLGCAGCGLCYPREQATGGAR